MITPEFPPVDFALPRGPRPTVAIIGAGCIGLSLAWLLAEAGCPVTVFDRGAAGAGATWAAGGMLAASVEVEPGEQTLLGLTRLSQQLWPAFARRLTALTGQDIGYRDDGTLVVALTRDDAEQLRFTYEFQRGLGLDMSWLSGAQARQREPHLHPGTVAAVLGAGDHQVDNRLLAPALVAALRHAGATLHEHCPVDAVDLVAGRAAGVICGDRRFPADIVVVAAGAWSRGIGGLPPAARPPVRPVKGQMLALAMDPQVPLLRHVLWAPRAYLIPRRDGRLVIGATTEERGFDTDLTAGGIYSLLDGAWRAIPAVEELKILEFWTGFRPGSRDDAPILGPTAVDGLVMATGHHRNGILLTPVTAVAVAGHILGAPLPAVARPFTLARFQPATGSVAP